MFVGLGTLINICAIIGGASLGVLVGSRMTMRTRTLITEILGLITILGAVSALSPMWSDRYTNRLGFACDTWLAINWRSNRFGT
jgi:uncharacterized protein